VLYLHVARFSALVLHRHSPAVVSDKSECRGKIADSRLSKAAGLREALPSGDYYPLPLPRASLYRLAGMSGSGED
jgi:hypothetical protein